MESLGMALLSGTIVNMLAEYRTCCYQSQNRLEYKSDRQNLQKSTEQKTTCCLLGNDHLEISDAIFFCTMLNSIQVFGDVPVASLTQFTLKYVAVFYNILCCKFYSHLILSSERQELMLRE